MAEDSAGERSEDAKAQRTTAEATTEVSGGRAGCGPSAAPTPSESPSEPHLLRALPAPGSQHSRWGARNARQLRGGCSVALRPPHPVQSSDSSGGPA